LALKYLARALMPIPPMPMKYIFLISFNLLN
jgi:hypothetical protein